MGKNSKGIRTYSRVYILTTDSKTENEYDVGSHPSLPYIGEQHDVDTEAYCIDLEITQTNGYVGWEAKAVWSTEFELAQNPTDDPAIIEWDGESYQKVAMWDRNGRAILNSAGDFFDPPLMMDDDRAIVTIQKNLAAVPSWIFLYRNAVNAASFTVDGISVAEELAKIQSLRVGSRQFRNGTSFRTLTITMCLQADGWDLAPLDQGFRKIGYGGALENIRNDGDNERPTAPVPLDGSGGVLQYPSPTNAFYIEALVYHARDFSVLPLT